MGNSANDPASGDAQVDRGSPRRAAQPNHQRRIIGDHECRHHLGPPCRQRPPALIRAGQNHPGGAHGGIGVRLDNIDRGANGGQPCGAADLLLDPPVLIKSN